MTYKPFSFPGVPFGGATWAPSPHHVPAAKTCGTCFVRVLFFEQSSSSQTGVRKRQEVCLSLRTKNPLHGLAHRRVGECEARSLSGFGSGLQWAAMGCRLGAKRSDSFWYHEQLQRRGHPVAGPTRRAGATPSPTGSLAQSTAIARAMARICNDERATFGVMSGHDRKTLSLSGGAIAAPGRGRPVRASLV